MNRARAAPPLHAWVLQEKCSAVACRLFTVHTEAANHAAQGPPAAIAASAALPLCLAVPSCRTQYTAVPYGES